jgi:hypothetical protein
MDAPRTEIQLSFEEKLRFEAMIDESIIAEYDGDLERWDDERDGGYNYTPLDTDHIRDLLTKLWGELLSKEALDDAFLRLTEDGAAGWPCAYCEDDEDERPLSDLRPE